MPANPHAGASTRERVLRDQRRGENFPVALRLLPRRLQADLVAVYDVARVIDDLGDRAAGDRTALLTDFRRDLATIWAGGWPENPVLRRLVPTVRARGLDREPFDRLVRANLLDQRVHRYSTFAQLREYCILSADPVGRIVLAVFEVGSPATIELSDRICTALQLIEHWQDVAEDRRAGRVYLPQEDLAAFDVVEAELDRPAASPSLCRLMSFQITRAAELLDSGAPLVSLLRDWARLAVAGYVAGGRAALDALRRSGGDVLTGPPRPRRRDVAYHLARLLTSPSGGGDASHAARAHNAAYAEFHSKAVAHRSNDPDVELGAPRAPGGVTGAAELGRSGTTSRPRGELGDDQRHDQRG